MNQESKAFDKKRQIEKNTIGIKKEFSVLKSRIMAGNNSFRAQHFNLPPKITSALPIKPTKLPSINAEKPPLPQ